MARKNQSPSGLTPHLKDLHKDVKTCVRTYTQKNKKFVCGQKRKTKEEKKLDLLGRNTIYVINDEEAIIRGIRAMVPDRESPVNIVAFIMMKVSPNLDNWTYKDIEFILEAGYQLYMDSYNTYKPDSTNLGLYFVIRRLILKDTEVRVKIRNPIFCCQVSKDNILQILTEYFTYETFTLFHCANQLISIYFKSGYFYVFDPYSRDIRGNKCEDGSAVLMRFGNLSNLVDKILNNCTPSSEDSVVPDGYELIPLDIISVYPL